MSTPATPPDLACRFASALGGLLRVLAHRASIDRSATTLMVLVWTRINRTRQRFAALLARYRAGTLRAPRRYRPAPGRRPPPPPAVAVPRRFAWLSAGVPEARAYAGYLRQMLDDPDMTGLLEATPQAGRMLRPLCRMLGIPPTPAMRAQRQKPAAPAKRKRPTASARAAESRADAVRRNQPPRRRRHSLAGLDPRYLPPSARRA